MEKLSQILSIYQSKDVDKILKKLTKFDLNEQNLYYEDIKEHFSFLGNNPSNASSIGILRKGEKGLIERITNAIDAVTEKQKYLFNIEKPLTSNDIIEKAFPKYYLQKFNRSHNNYLEANDASEQVTLIVHDGCKANKPTFDIIDLGMGLKGDEFKSTILSIHSGNKISRDKGYLIGAFGQGGSTSLPFTYSTIIISKVIDDLYFTIIKSVELLDYKNRVYVFLCFNDTVPTLLNDITNDPIFTNFLNSSSGTIVRMIETDISKNYRENAITEKGMLGDYLDTELFNVCLPIKVFENRKTFQNSKSIRYSFGTYNKLFEYDVVNANYSGKFSLKHHNKDIDIEYFSILPINTGDWGSDSICESVYQEFNVHKDPIIYIVNGQTITTENFTKLSNAGLSFLKYRLLVVVNLDSFGTDKYRFFTSDRAKIVDTDLTKGFISSLINNLVNIKKLQELNQIIADMSTSFEVDNQFLADITKEVKKEYANFLKHSFFESINWLDLIKDANNYNDEVTTIKLFSHKHTYYADEEVSFILKTNGNKDANKKLLLDEIIDDAKIIHNKKSITAGKIKLTYHKGVISTGVHKIHYCVQNSSLITNSVDFTVLPINQPINDDQKKSLSLDLIIRIVKDSDLICEVVKDLIKQQVTVIICLDHQLLKKEVFIHSKSTDKIAVLKSKIVKPIVLYSLFLGDNYNEIVENEEKNELMLAFIKSFVISTEEKKEIKNNADN